MDPRIPKVSLSVAALALLGGCQAEPPPVCVTQRATGGINYVARYANMAVTSGDPDAPDCTLFATTVPPSTWGLGAGVPNYAYPQFWSALQAQLGGQPFRLGVIGLDKFAPAAIGAPSLVSIVPDIFGGTVGAGTSSDGGTSAPGVAYGIGALEFETPDAMDLCYVRDFPPFGAPVDWGRAIGQRAVAFHFTDFVFYVTAAAPGTQLQARVEIALGACTARFDVIGYAPAATCARVDPGGKIEGPEAGVQPLTADDVDPGLCTHFHPDPNDDQWANYANNGYVEGSSVNQNFPLVCDTASGFCALSIPPAPAVPTVPILSSPGRP